MSSNAGWNCGGQILDELIIAGEIQESSKKAVLRVVSPLLLNHRDAVERMLNGSGWCVGGPKRYHRRSGDTGGFVGEIGEFSKGMRTARWGIQGAAGTGMM